VADRFVPLTGADNFRDLGGYRTTDGLHTKWGALYRSNSLHGLTESDKETLTALGVREVFDLRGDGEVKKDPDSLPPVTYTRLPIGPKKMMSLRVKPAVGQEYGEAFLGAGYKQIIDDHGRDVYVPWLKSLASQRGPVKPTVLHCTAGKDRTGVAYGILLELLGVPRETILADYSLTNITYPTLAKQFDRSGYPATFKSLLVAYPKALAEALDYIDQKYGSVEKYVASSGLTAKQIHQLKSRYLE
jgi:protein-tyrosine phosphatase